MFCTEVRPIGTALLTRRTVIGRQCNSVETAQPGDRATNPDIVMPECYASSQRVDSLARVVITPGGGPRVMVSTAASHARVRGSIPGLGGLKETKLFLPHPRVKVSIVGSLRHREVACSASDRQGSNFESCIWRTVSSRSFHHPQEVILVQFSLYVHKGGLKPDSFHFSNHSSPSYTHPATHMSRLNYKGGLLFTMINGSLTQQCSHW